MDSNENVDNTAANFGALSNSLRVRILLALTETRKPDWDHNGMSYSDLRSAVGVEDGGRFNYHLDELRDQFVYGQDGHYRLTAAGSRVVDEIHAGTFSGAPEAISGRLDRSCRVCNRQLEATFDNGVISVSCPTHGTMFDMWLRFAAATDRDLTELFAWGNRRGLWYLESVSWDVCPHCAGRFGGAIFQTTESDDHHDGSETVIARMMYNTCGISFGVPAYQYALTKPPTIAFLHDHGIDYRSIDVEYGQTEWDHRATRTGDGVSVTLTVGNDRLILEPNQSLNTRSYRRHPLES